MFNHSLLAADAGWETLLQAVSLRDYNTRIVLAGTALLGLSGGIVGTFLVLRQRALAADVVSHASLPGIAVAFLLAEQIAPGQGRSMWVLLCGAFVTGFLGMALTLAIRRWTRIKEDAAMAIVLGIFFGCGMALFTVVQRTRTSNAAGLSHFIFGKAASLVAADVWLIGMVSAIVTVICCGLFKELALLCFDEEFAAARGYPTHVLDWLLTLMSIVVTLIGLQSVGLLLVVGLLLIPATAARFWTNNLKVMAGLSGLIGGLSCIGGVLFSAAFPRIAAGAVIVLVAATLFLSSLLFGSVRGLWPRWRAQREFEQRIGRSDLLRACFEYLEPLLQDAEPDQLSQMPIPAARLQRMRGWPEFRFRRLTTAAERAGLLERTRNGWRLTAAGAQEALAAVRQHRLWEIYLLTETDLEPRLVDRGADGIEHVLDPDQLANLETLLAAASQAAVPASPHPIFGVAERGPSPPTTGPQETHDRRS